MRGTVYRRGGKWGYAVHIGYGPDGKRQRHVKSGFHTRKEAQQALNEVLHRIDQGNYVSPSKQTLATFLGEWLDALRTKDLSPSTLDSYRTIVESHIVPRLGSVKLQAVTPKALNKFYADLLDGGRADGRGGLSPKSVRNVHIVLRKALGDAVKWNELARNVAEFADPPKQRRAGRADMQTWIAPELRAFLDFAADNRLYPAFHLDASTGMRRGEVLGVRWKDLDLDAGALAVRQTVTTVQYEIIIRPVAKSDGSTRQIALDKETVAVLRAWKKRQLEERVKIGAAYQDSGLVFTKVDGSVLHPDLFSQTFDRLVAKSGLPRIRLHDLRHTHATLALQAGVHPKVVSERLGHATVAFTLDVYSHAVKGMQEDAAELVAGLISGGSR